jgi:hypothetical protein
MKLISIAEKLIKKLRKEGKVKDVNLDFLDSEEFQKELEKIKEDSERKQKQSWEDTKDIILD